MATAQDLLKAVVQLPPDELQEFTRQFLSWQKQSRKSAADVYQEEAALLAEIEKNSHLPSEEQQHFNRLRRRRQAEKLTKSEEADLQDLWKRVEGMNVARLQALTQLAQRRGTDVSTLMHELSLAENYEVF